MWLILILMLDVGCWPAISHVRLGRKHFRFSTDYLGLTCFDLFDLNSFARGTNLLLDLDYAQNWGRLSRDNQAKHTTHRRPDWKSMEKWIWSQGHSDSEPEKGAVPSGVLGFDPRHSRGRARIKTLNTPGTRHRQIIYRYTPINICNHIHKH